MSLIPTLAEDSLSEQLREGGSEELNLLCKTRLQRQRKWGPGERRGLLPAEPSSLSPLPHRFSSSEYLRKGNFLPSSPSVGPCSSSGLPWISAGLLLLVTSQNSGVQY